MQAKRSDKVPADPIPEDPPKTRPAKTATQSSNPPSPTPKAKVASRVPVPPARGRGCGRTVYFRDEEMLEWLDLIRVRYPRATTSAIVQQMLDAFRKEFGQLDGSSPDVRVIEFQAKVVIS